MESENPMVNNTEADTGTVDGGPNEAQVKEKMFTQTELDTILQKRLSQATKKFSEIDVDEYKELRQMKNQLEEEQLIKRQEFDKVLQKTKQQSAKETAQLREELEKIKVDGALISASSSAKAVNPEHVSKLLRSNVKLSEDGGVTVTDGTGNARFNDNGDNMTVDELVEEFLSANSYFRVAGPSGAGSTSNTDTRSSTEFDLNDLDMTNPEHRAKYKAMRQKGLV
jgi:hypothetical protein